MSLKIARPNRVLRATAALLCLAPFLSSAGSFRAARAAPKDPTPPKSASKSSPDPGSDDYADDEKMQGLRHWDHMPVRVYFAPDASSTKDRIRDALAGFDEWTAASKGVLYYVVVAKASEADVTMRFVDTSNVPSADIQRIGETETETRAGVLLRVRVRIAVGDANAEQITEDAAHEFGHALGIAGHSSDSHDLMYPTTTRYYMNGVLVKRPERTVTKRDLNTIKRAYAALFAREPADTGHH